MTIKYRHSCCQTFYFNFIYLLSPSMYTSLLYQQSMRILHYSKQCWKYFSISAFKTHPVFSVTAPTDSNLVLFNPNFILEKRQKSHDARSGIQHVSAIIFCEFLVVRKLKFQTPFWHTLFCYLKFF